MSHPWAWYVCIRPPVPQAPVIIYLEIAHLQADILTTHYAAYAEGVLYCRLSQKIVPAFDYLQQSNYVWPFNEHYHIFMALGHTADDNTRAHTINSDSDLYPMASEAPVKNILKDHEAIYEKLAPATPSLASFKLVRPRTELI